MSSESELSNSSPQQRTTLKSQKAGLVRIVKAQVTLLISSLNEENYTRKASEIQTLIDTHGEEIREHLFRYLLSDIYKQDLIESPQFRLLKENAVFTNQAQEKQQAVVSFSVALEQFCESESASQLDLEDLFRRLDIDALDKVILTLPLVSGTKPNIVEKAKSIFTSNISNAIGALSNMKVIPESVLQYIFNSLVLTVKKDTYNFQDDTLAVFVKSLAALCTDQSMAEEMQRFISKNGKITIHDQQFKQSIIEMYMNSPSSVTRILDSIKELDVFPDILDTLPLALALDLVYLADHLKLLNLESWLKEKLNNPQRKQAYAIGCLNFINQKITIESQRAAAANVDLPISVPPDVLNTFFKVLSESSLSPQAAEVLKTLENHCLQMKTQPISSGTEVSFKPDIEEEANRYYERVYNGELSLEAMIQLLKTLSVSKDPRETDVFACMIHNLFDEYSFFPKYPDKELSITSILFGSLVQHRLVSDSTLSMTLRYILESIHDNPVGSKMFNFGVQALRQFQTRLSEWPQFCSHLLQIPDFVQSQPDLAAYVQSILKAQDVQNEEPANTTETYSFTSIHVPKVSVPKEVMFIEPPTEIQEKILFIINNVAQNNIETKVADLSQVLEPSSYKWFSHYLVVKRVSAEPNYHELYILVLDSVNSQLLNALILSETYTNIIILLNSEKTVSNSSERTLLKNLGSWLGKMTLAKNKPILQKHVSFKGLLLEGYDQQRLIVTIPFVCKVLEQGATSKVFRPPNPWLMAIMKFLVELYDSADLKLTLKFEIEVLCKCLSLELKDIPPTSILKDRRFQIDAARNAFAAAPYPGRDSDALSNKVLENGAPFMGDTNIAIPNIAPYIVFNPQVTLYTNRPAAKRLVLQAFTESIREIIGPVVERAVAIAVVSTRDLISKDFMMEPDENKMRKAAHLMAQNLAASLAMVTSKEPLRLSIVSNLKTIFLAHGLNDNMAEQAIILTVADNLDLMCAVIEKAAMEKATIEVDEVLTTAYMSRKKHHEQRPNQPFVDMGMYQMSGFINALPPALRPKPNGLQPAQLSIYENFMRIPRVAPVTTNNDPSYGAYNNGSPATGFENTPGSQPLPQVPAHLILERFAQFITELEALLSQTNVSSFNNLPQQSDIPTIIRQIPLLALSSFDKAEAARTFAQKVVQLLYKSEKTLAIEVYVVLLEHLCEVSPNVGALVTSWLTHADDERKYNVPVTVALIKAGLINLPEQDQELSILIDSGRPSAIEFSARLIRACLFGEYPLATRQEFMASLEALSRLKSNQLPESVLSLIDDMRKVPTQQVSQVNEDKMKDVNVREQLQLYFAEWVRLCQHPSTTDKTLLAFATQLQQQSFFKVDDLTSLFYRICIEASIDHAIKFKMLPTQSPSMAYQPIDAFSKLIVSLVQVTMIEGKADPLANFTKALSVIVLCLSQHHEVRGDQFDQRPFLRLFTCILADLHTIEQSIQPLYLPLLTAFSNTLYTLQPTHFPGFIFAWLQIISHRFFMPQLLLAENQKGWPTFQRLLISLFQFLAPYLKHVELQDTTRMLYRGTLRVLLVLLHDFPEFLCDYHYSFCDVIPSTCIQMRNLILSAFPRHMRLPDPFTPNLKIDLLPEIHESPRVLADFTSILEESGVKKEIDAYLETGKAPSNHFLKDMVVKMKGTSKLYNTPLINAITFYVGSVTISKGIPVHKGPALDIYEHLLNELESEGRYIFLSAIANQLRYPNSHTHYFSCLLLYLFVETKKEIAKEQITRVLLERLIVNRPHPWGLLITFIELIRNPSYSFWSHSFTRCASDIEKLFESVSRSINQN